MKVAWYTDLHLEALNNEQISVLFHNSIGADAIFITGDISNGDRICRDLTNLTIRTPLPIYFVLGNSDYHKSDLLSVRENLKYTALGHALYLPHVKSCFVSSRTRLVGVDGWYDGGYATAPTFTFADRDKIRDLMFSSEEILTRWCATRSNAEARSLEYQLARAITFGCDNIFILTHVPPFVEGIHITQSYDATSKALGNVIKRAATDNPDIHFTSLSGHIHKGSTMQILNNLTAKTGHATKGLINYVETIEVP